MKILLNNFDLNEALKKDHNIGFVPTMGSIHEGHVSLVKRSKKESKKTLVKGNNLVPSPANGIIACLII